MITSNQGIERSGGLTYTVLYHEKGYIRLSVPSLKNLSWFYLFLNFRKALPFSLSPAIKDFQVNPLKGDIVIVYEPDRIDILDYIRQITLDPKVKKLIRGEAT